MSRSNVTARDAVATDKRVDQAITRVKAAITKLLQKLPPGEAATVRDVMRDFFTD